MAPSSRSTSTSPKKRFRPMASSSSPSVANSEERIELSPVSPKMTTAIPLDAVIQEDVEGISVTRPEIGQLPRTISLLSAISFVIGNIIGSGIFATAGQVLLHTGTIAWCLSIWLFAGFIALMGSLCYAELGTMFPESGSEYFYLTRGISPLAGFIFTWTSVFISLPGASALMAIAFGNHLAQVFIFDESSKDVPNPDNWLKKLLAVMVLLLISLINSRSSKTGKLVNGIFTASKLLTVIVIGLTGLLIIAGVSHPEKQAFALSFDLPPKDNGAGIAQALYSALWSLDGWNSVNMIAGEVIKPSKNIPLSLLIGIPTVIFSYLAVVIAYFAVLPLSTIAESQWVAINFGDVVYGRTVGRIIVPIAVACSTLGAINSSVWVSSRLTVAAAAGGSLPPIFGKLHSKWQTPIPAILLQLFLSVIMISAGDFDKLLRYFSFAMWIFYGSAVSCLLIFRIREPSKERPFRVWTIIPVVFVLFAITLTIYPLTSTETLYDCLIGFGIMSIGIPVYYFHEWHKKYGPFVTFKAGYLQFIESLKRSLYPKHKTKVPFSDDHESDPGNPMVSLQ